MWYMQAEYRNGHVLHVCRLNIVLCILRFFSYYRFQEKLNVLTMTFKV